MATETIDLVTVRPNGTFVMVIVEEGPWHSDPEIHLRALQERLYNYLDIAIDGHLAKLYPDSQGKDVVVGIDAYDTPTGEVSEFLERFASYVGSSAEIQGAIKSKGFIRAVDFECTESTLQE